MEELGEMTIQIAPDGSIVIHVEGIAGERCLELTQIIEEIKGFECVETTYTDEFEEKVVEQGRRSINR